MALGIDGDADHFAQYIGGRIMKKVFDKMQRELRRRGVVTLHASAALRASRRDIHKRKSRGKQNWQDEISLGHFYPQADGCREYMLLAITQQGPGKPPR